MLLACHISQPIDEQSDHAPCLVRTGLPPLAQKSLPLCEVMDMAFLLIKTYSGRRIIAAESVAKDFFFLTTEKFVRKVSPGTSPSLSFIWKSRRNARRVSTSTISPNAWTNLELQRSRMSATPGPGRSQMRYAARADPCPSSPSSAPPQIHMFEISHFFSHFDALERAHIRFAIATAMRLCEI